MTTLTAIVRLPGSGKSHLVRQLSREQGLPEHLAIEDYMRNSLNSSPEFSESQFRQPFVDALNAGQDCILADIELCVMGKRRKLVHPYQGVDVLRPTEFWERFTAGGGRGKTQQLK